MSNRKGFVLLSTLWLLVLVTAVVTPAVALARLELRATSNRNAARRAEWARLACVAILEARTVAAGRPVAVDSTDLGRGTWCRASVVECPRPCRGGSLDLRVLAEGFSGAPPIRASSVITGRVVPGRIAVLRVEVQ